MPDRILAISTTVRSSGVPTEWQSMVTPEPWTKDALCAQVDSEMFFPEKGGSTREAKRICAACDVAEQCLAYALRNDERFGIWGGVSERERRAMRQGKKPLPTYYERAVKTDEREFQRMIENAIESGAVRREPPKPSVPAFKPADLVRPVAEELTPPEVVEAPAAVEPARASRPPKWAVRRVWVAVDPDGKMHGPFDGQPAGIEFVREQLTPAPVVEEKPKRAPRPRIEWTAEIDDLIRRRNGERVSDAKIAAELSMSQPAVSSRRKLLGLPSLFRSPNQRSKSSAA